MNITLKKVKIFEGMEGTGLNAEVFVDGVNVCFAIDEGCGGEMIFRVHDKAKMKELEDYAKSLPKEPLMNGDKPYERDGKVVMLQQTVEDLVNKAFNDIEKDKLKKKFEKKMNTCILVGVPGDSKYGEYNFKKPLSSFPKGELQAAILRIKTQLKKGEVILNTNIAALGLQL